MSGFSYYNGINGGSITLGPAGGISLSDIEGIIDDIELLEERTAIVKSVTTIDALKSVPEPLDGTLYRVVEEFNATPPDYGIWIFIEELDTGLLPQDGTTGSWVKTNVDMKPKVTYLVDRYYESDSTIDLNALTVIGGVLFPITNDEVVLTNLHRCRDGSKIERKTDLTIQANFDIIKGTLLDIIVE